MSRTIYPIQKQETERKAETKSKGGENEQGRLDMMIAAFAQMPLARLFLILALIIYGVMAYSKKDQGVNTQDLSIFVLFLLIIILLVCFITLMRKIYYSWNWSLIRKNYKKWTKGHCKKFVVLLVIILLIILALCFKHHIVNFLSGVFVKIVQ